MCDKLQTKTTTTLTLSAAASSSSLRFTVEVGILKVTLPPPSGHSLLYSLLLSCGIIPAIIISHTNIPNSHFLLHTLIALCVCDCVTVTCSACHQNILHCLCYDTDLSELLMFSSQMKAALLDVVSDGQSAYHDINKYTNT